MTILSSIQTPFGSELSLSGLLSIEETIRKRVQANTKQFNSNDTIDTESCSEWTFSSLEEPETEEPQSILKAVRSHQNIESDDDERLKSWIEQPTPSPSSNPTRRRRRISGESTPAKYYCVKTTYPGRSSRRRRQEPSTRGPRTEKTVEEQWVRTCRFLW